MGNLTQEILDALSVENVVMVDPFNCRILNGILPFVVNNETYHVAVDKRTLQVANVDMIHFKNDSQMLAWLYPIVAACGKVIAIYPHETKNRAIISITFEEEVSALRCQAYDGKEFPVDDSQNVVSKKMIKLVVDPRQYQANISWFSCPALLSGRLRSRDRNGFNIASTFRENFPNIKVNVDLPKAKPVSLLPFSSSTVKPISIFIQLRTVEEKEKYPKSSSLRLDYDQLPKQWLMKTELNLELGLKPKPVRREYQSLRSQPLAGVINPAPKAVHGTRPPVIKPSSQHLSSATPSSSSAGPSTDVDQSKPTSPTVEQTKDKHFPALGSLPTKSWDTKTMDNVAKPKAIGKIVETTGGKELFDGGYSLFKNSSHLAVAKKKFLDKYEKPYMWEDFALDQYTGVKFDPDILDYLKDHNKHNVYGFLFGDGPEGLCRMLCQLQLSSIFKANLVDQLDQLVIPFGQTVETGMVVEGLRRKKQEFDVRSRLTSEDNKGRILWGLGYDPDTHNVPVEIPLSAPVAQPSNKLETNVVSNGQNMNGSTSTFVANHQSVDSDQDGSEWQTVAKNGKPKHNNVGKQSNDKGDKKTDQKVDKNGNVVPGSTIDWSKEVDDYESEDDLPLVFN